ncbi:MAG: hypothetical protein H0T84_15175 [Tatlockia sp.]|nr:hypothetical protein [Tatlockia sp.]
MSKHTELFEVLSELIHVQIKKYVNFTSCYPGPDAWLNASISLDEVNELLQLQELLIEEIETHFDEAVFFNVIDQIKFYLELEMLRSNVDWLVIDNKIYNPANKQLAILEEIAESTEIDFSVKSLPATKVQEQCQHDGYEIAYRSLTLALNKRYEHCAIATLYQECQDFLQSSQLEKRAIMFSKELATNSEMTHIMIWHDLVKRYQKIEPESRIFSKNHTWGEKTVDSPSIFTKYNLMLFGGCVLATGFVSKMLPYFIQQEDKMPFNLNI